MEMKIEESQGGIQLQIVKILAQQGKSLFENQKHLVCFKAGEIIFKQDTPVAHVLFLNKGLVKAYLDKNGHKNLILKIAMPFEIFTEPDLSGNVYHQYSLSAIEDSVISFIDKQRFTELMFKNHEILKAFLGSIQINQENIVSKLISVNGKCAKGRIAESILYLSEKVYKSDDFNLNISKINLSELAGVSKESTFKVLNEFERDCLISVNGINIKILNKNIMKMVAENG